MVVDDDKIIFKVCLLHQYRFDGVTDGTDTVAYRNDDGGLIFEVTGRELNLLELRCQISPDFFQMFVHACSISIWRSRFLGST